MFDIILHQYITYSGRQRNFRLRNTIATNKEIIHDPAGVNSMWLLPLRSALRLFHTLGGKPLVVWGNSVGAGHTEVVGELNPAVPHLQQ